MNPVWFLPAVVVLLGLGAWLGPRASGRVDGFVGRVARATCGRFVSEDADRERVIEAAFVRSSYRAYAARTYLYAAIGLVAGGVGGAYLVAGGLLVIEPLVRKLAQLPDAMADPLGFTHGFTLVLSPAARWAVVIGGGVVVGVVLAIVAYAMRWKLPESNAAVRRRSIDAGLPRTTAFMFALSRGGVAFPAIVRRLGRHRSVFGESAAEMQVSVREMDLFGRDVISAVRRMSRRSPSDRFKTFGENLASVLQSGSDLSGFLRESYERFQAEAEERQAEVLELLATIAEGYVTTMVAGVLFFITILLVFGLTTTDTLWALRIVIYLMIPLANAAFVVYLAGKLDALGVARETGHAALERLAARTPSPPNPPAEGRRADGGLVADGATLDRLDRHDRLGRVRSALRRPVRTAVWNPGVVLYVSVPVALVAFIVRFPSATQAQGIHLRALDDLIVQSVLFVLGTYAIARELYRRRVDRIEAATPDLLERLASLNEAGMTVVEGFDRIRGSDLGVLTPEVERIWRDVEFGATVDDALVRFGRRVRTSGVTRVVTLLTSAMRASGRMGDVLRIAATQARADLKMRRRRRSQMLTYLVVIYIAFAVFLVIILAVNEVLIPSLPETVQTPGADEVNRLGVDANQFARLGGVDKAAYSLVFFHAALVQAVCSGFVGGQLGAGSLKDGAKHAAALLAVAYVAFLLISAPVASLGSSTAVSTGDALLVPGVSTSNGGYVVAYGTGVNGTELGRSAYLPPGRHDDVTVALDRPIRDDRTIVLVAHMDTDGDEQFDFEAPYLPGRGTDGPYPTLSDRGHPGVEVQVEYVGG